eukprot:352534-Chlamydomonas_euryale.AAC.10
MQQRRTERECQLSAVRLSGKALTQALLAAAVLRRAQAKFAVRSPRARHCRRVACAAAARRQHAPLVQSLGAPQLPGGFTLLSQRQRRCSVRCRPAAAAGTIAANLAIVIAARAAGCKGPRKRGLKHRIELLAQRCYRGRVGAVRRAAHARRRCLAVALERDSRGGP